MRPSVYYIAILAVLPWAGSSPLLGGQAQLDQEISVHVSAAKELSDSWHVTKASLREAFSGTTGELEVQNTSAKPLSNAMFYAEYFDRAGRFCFSLVFPESRKDESPMSPGEIRQLYSVGVGLEPALKPTEVRLQLVRQSVPGEVSSMQQWPVKMKAPVTFSGNLPAGTRKLQLSPDISLGESPIDLLFANVAVDEKGIATNIQILNSANKDVKDWFERLVRELAFYPATSSGAPEAGEALFLVSAVGEPNRLAEFWSDAAASSWVQAYASTRKSEVPSVTRVVITRPPTKVKLMGTTAWTERPQAPPGVFELSMLGSEWSNPAVVFVRAESMPLHFARQLAPPDMLQ
jgi:hypothetical protein